MLASDFFNVKGTEKWKEGIILYIKFLSYDSGLSSMADVVDSVILSRSTVYCSS